MEVILNCGDKINIPNGCKAEIKGGVITIEKEITEGKFKEGDFFATLEGENVGIVKSQRLDGNVEDVYSHWDDFQIQNPHIPIRCTDIRLATEDEKQRAIDEMKARGLWWNAEEKRIEKIRWRAEKGDCYFFLLSSLNVSEATEDRGHVDNYRYSAYNYFRTKEDAEEAAKLVKATLKKFHEDYESNKKQNS